MAATHGQQQHRVGLGEPCLDAEQDEVAIISAGEQRGAPRRRRRAPPSRSAAPRRSRRAATAGDRARSWCAPAERRAPRPAFTTAGLQPIDADRLLVADLVLKADVDVVAGLDHLLGGLREARLVAVDGGIWKKPGRNVSSAHDDQHGNARAHASASAKSSTAAGRARKRRRDAAGAGRRSCSRPRPAKSRRTIEKSPRRGKRSPSGTRLRIARRHSATAAAPARCRLRRLASMTVSRTKPGPSGSKNSVRRLAAGSGTPLTSTVSGCDAARDLQRDRIGLPAGCASSSRAPFGGNMMRSGGSQRSPGKPPGRKRCSGGGSLALAAKIAPLRRTRAAAPAACRCARRRRTGSAPRQRGRPARAPARRPAVRPRRRSCACRRSRPTRRRDSRRTCRS